MQTTKPTYGWTRRSWYLPLLEGALLASILVVNVGLVGLVLSIDYRLFWPVSAAQLIWNLKLHRWWIFSQHRNAIPGWRWL